MTDLFVALIIFSFAFVGTIQGIRNLVRKLRFDRPDSKRSRPTALSQSRTPLFAGRFTWLRLGLGTVALGVLLYLLPFPLPVLAQIAAGYSEYYISGGTDQLWDIFEDIDNDPDLVESDGLRTIIAVTAASDKTTIYYDHWEDGYEADPLNPVQASSEQYTVNEGEVQEFEGQNIPVRPRGNNYNDCGGDSKPISTRCYDGGDRTYTAGGPVVVTVANWPESIGTVFSLAWEVLPTKPFRIRYTIPVGENLSPTYNDFAKTYVIVQSAYDNNTVTIDDPGSAGIEVTATLNEGQLTQLHRIDAGTVISSTEPVQVQFIVGNGPRSGNSSEIRGYSALPSPLWDTEYYNPVGGSSAGTDLYIYNPNAGDITVEYEDQVGSGSFTLAGNSTVAYSDSAAAGREVPVGSGVYLRSTQNFWAIGSGDPERAGYDWGFSLVPAFILSDEYFLGWAPGSNRDTPTENGSPVYVTPVQDGTVVYVDYSPTDGTVDATYSLDRLESQKVFDPDNENTGMHVWATGPIALAWGEDPDTASSSNPYLDLGYTTLPLPFEFMDVTMGLTKTVEPVSLPPGAGQVATFTLQIPVYELDSGQPFTMTNLVLTDTLPSGWLYRSGTTIITLPDSSQQFDDPDINGRKLTWDFGGSQNMKPNDLITVVFQVETTASTPPNFNENCAEVEGHIDDDTFVARDCAPVYIKPATIDKDTSTPLVQAGGVATYTIVVDNTDSQSVIADVTVTDTLPTGFTYAGGNITVSDSNAVTRTATIDPTVGDNTLVWGTWTIGRREALTITFSVNIDVSVPPGTYDNTAEASYRHEGKILEIDDIGPEGQDDDTPSGRDPEDDEDVTLTLGLATIGDRVWIDTDPDGIQDGSESGLSGVTVRLYDGSNSLLSTTTTIANGVYSFTNLMPGDYYIEYALQPGYFFTEQDQGGDDTLDSDANPATGRTITTTLDSNEVDLSWDAGIYRPALELEKSVALSRVAPNQEVTYTITITNTGDVALNPVNVTDTLPSGFGYKSGSGQPVEPTVDDQELIWTDVTSPTALLPNQSFQLTFVASVPDINGTHINTVVAEGTHPGGVVTDTDSTPVTVTDPEVDLSKDTVPPGAVNGIITFTIRIVNTGPSTLDVVPLIDRFRGPIEYIGGTPPADSVDNTNQVLGWNDLTATFGRDLAPNDTFLLSTVFRITADTNNFSMTNVATVTDAIDVYDNEANDDTDVEVLVNEPTAIELLSFTGDRQGNLVVLNWTTAVEIDNYGFRILRSATRSPADAQEIGFVAGQGYGTTSGASYTFVDKNAAADQTYTYWLVDIDLNGVETTHDPVTVQPVEIDSGEPAILYLPLLLKND